MATAAQSEVTFQGMLTKWSLDHLKDQFHKRGWTNAALFAQSVGISYQNVAEKRFDTKVIAVLTKKKYTKNWVEPKEATPLRILFNACVVLLPVSYTHLTLPTKRIV